MSPVNASLFKSQHVRCDSCRRRCFWRMDRLSTSAIGETGHPDRCAWSRTQPFQFRWGIAHRTHGLRRRRNLYALGGRQLAKGRPFMVGIDCKSHSEYAFAESTRLIAVKGIDFLYTLFRLSQQGSEPSSILVGCGRRRRDELKKKSKDTRGRLVPS